jgi:ABC-type sugar transport system substrate-binding protein
MEGFTLIHLIGDPPDPSQPGQPDERPKTNSTQRRSMKRQKRNGSMWMRNLSGAAAAVVAAITIAGCGGASTGGSAGSTAGSGGLDGKKVTLVTCTNSNAWCSRWSADTQKALEAKGVKVTVLTHNFDASQEVQILNQAISSRPDLVLLHETADTKAVVPVIKKAKQQGVPIINIDGRAEDDAVPDLTSQVVHDNVELGRIAARNIVQGLKELGKESGNVAVISGTASMLITQDRMKGFNEEMAKSPQYKIVATEDGNWDPVKSGQLAQQLLAKFRDDLDAVYGMADYQAVPIVQAAKQAGIKVGAKEAGLIITGSNCTAAGNTAVLAGDMYGSATEDPPTAAKYSAEAAEKFLTGEELPPIIPIPVEQVTSANAGEFTTRCTY